MSRELQMIIDEEKKEMQLFYENEMKKTNDKIMKMENELERKNDEDRKRKRCFAEYMIRDGKKDVSFISGISGYPEDSVRDLARGMGVSVF